MPFVTCRALCFLIVLVPFSAVAAQTPPPQDPPAEEQPVVEIEETVIVTATRTNTRLQDQPVRVEVIDPLFRPVQVETHTTLVRDVCEIVVKGSCEPVLTLLLEQNEGPHLTRSTRNASGR